MSTTPPAPATPPSPGESAQPASVTEPARDTVRLERDADGIVTLVLDDPMQSANTMNAAFIDSFERAVDQLVADRDRIRGVVVTSAKATFFAGGDLNELLAATPDQAADVFERSLRVKRALRALETLGRPVVAALNGTALGGGLEIALACHHRIALDAPKARFGLPEVTLGLLPGGGGVVRAVRLLGVTDALVKVLLEGRRYRVRAAEELGLLDGVAADQAELLARARAFIEANPEATQPWDAPGYRMPGGTPSHPKLAAQLPAFPARLRQRLGGAPYPAPRNILAAAVEGAQVDVETAAVIEARYFTELVVGQTAKNMIQAFFFDMRTVNSGRSRPQGEPARTVRRVAVLGAGMMGAGIAHACASAGFEVVLKDVSAEAAERGLATVRGTLDRAVRRGRLTEEAQRATLARITPTAEVAGVAGCDVVIEAVFEDPALKREVFQEVQDVVAPDALLCSNTSTLPIGQLAEGVRRPEDFVGLHFFSPVDRMALVEIVVGARTGDPALARAFDLVRALGKTPIVVRDGRGFFTSRVIGHFLSEGLAMVGEGIAPASIEQAAAQAGYPAGVLALLDELTLTLPRRIREETRQAVEEAGGEWRPHPGDAVLDRMLDEFDRRGRAAGAGFYDYRDGARAGLWPGLREHFAAPDDAAPVPFADLVDRLLLAPALDAVRCLDEGVLASVADANVGSLLGIGFPAWTGGVLQYLNGFPGGPAGALARAEELTTRYGDRFTPPAPLRELATGNGHFA
ncbi:3-hydroxyacyl-CoA dehydrogenase NAD-binding domain-containing protein [Streptomyces sp. DSM 44915]|uniref:3-hydroxyacyl-CoA dehydrogenase NAD-binding domain-containing protein n=1 Tax=Streptomyces chisholmiae TaxID=3075540 RepID=A0ABU2JJP9_9ACTN|nr:3-hydroxyacyl-CoA dehydrogenase NAD-binding domain-containing protein [Streptomyces sp. DSM 44915]MDT0264724.1 3-hydroxyacyl-CoA dehydrogenase NAD-binding domain-containing protein [Streptomyces sp. DSM 44915]